MYRKRIWPTKISTSPCAPFKIGIYFFTSGYQQILFPKLTYNDVWRFMYKINMLRYIATYTYMLVLFRPHVFFLMGEIHGMENFI